MLFQLIKIKFKPKKKIKNLNNLIHSKNFLVLEKIKSSN